MCSATQLAPRQWANHVSVSVSVCVLQGLNEIGLVADGRNLRETFDATDGSLVDAAEQAVPILIEGEETFNTMVTVIHVQRQGTQAEELPSIGISGKNGRRYNW